MKRIITLCCAILFGMVTLMAQTLEFVDATGKVIANGSTVTVNKLEIDPDSPEFPKYMSSGIFAHNISDMAQQVILSCLIKNIREGEVQACFSKSCEVWEEVGNYKTEEVLLQAKMSKGKSLEIKFLPKEERKDKAHCTIVLQLFTAKRENNEWVTDKSGPSITLIFDETTTGIGTLNTDKTINYNVYSLDGRLIGKSLPSLQGLAKGTYIIKKINDKRVISTEKKIVQ